MRMSSFCICFLVLAVGDKELCQQFDFVTKKSGAEEQFSRKRKRTQISSDEDKQGIFSAFYLGNKL